MSERIKFGDLDEISCENATNVIKSLEKGKPDETTPELIAKAIVHTHECKKCGDFLLREA